MNTKVRSNRRKNNRYLKELRKNRTKAESIVYEWFKEKEIRVIFQKGFFKPFHRICDFYIPKKKIIIEVDGPYHSNILDKDKRKDDLWAAYRGMGTIRVSNEQVYSGEFKKIFSQFL